MPKLACSNSAVGKLWTAAAFPDSSCPGKRGGPVAPSLPPASTCPFPAKCRGEHGHLHRAACWCRHAVSKERAQTAARNKKPPNTSTTESWIFGSSLLHSTLKGLGTGRQPPNPIFFPHQRTKISWSGRNPEHFTTDSRWEFQRAQKAPDGSRLPVASALLQSNINRSSVFVDVWCHTAKHALLT